MCVSVCLPPRLSLDAPDPPGRGSSALHRLPERCRVSVVSLPGRTREASRRPSSCADGPNAPGSLILKRTFVGILLFLTRGDNCLKSTCLFNGAVFTSFPWESIIKTKVSSQTTAF